MNWKNGDGWTLKQNHKRWVETGYCIGFMTKQGLILDLDNMSYRSAKRFAERLLNKYKLEGYLLIRSSPKNYHIVFNRYLTWRTITTILFSQYKCLGWAVFQMKSGYLTIRISKKNSENKPRILLKTGKLDKLCAKYLELYEELKDF